MFALLLILSTFPAMMLFGYFGGFIPIGLLAAVTIVFIALIATGPKTPSYSMWGVRPAGSDEKAVIRILTIFVLLPLALGAAADHYQWADLSALGDFAASILLRKGGT